MEKTKANSKLSDHGKEYYHAVFNICKYGIDEVHNKMGLVNNNIRMDLNLNLEQRKDIHKKKISELNSKYKDDLEMKLKNWYKVEESISKRRSKGHSGDQLDDNMIM